MASKQILFVLALLLNFSALKANDKIKFQLEDHQKYAGIFSGDINQNSSVHLLIYKDKDSDKFGLKPFFIDKDDKITAFDDVYFEDKPNIASFHYTENTHMLTILAKVKDEQLKTIDLNTRTLSVKSSDSDFKDVYLKVRQPDRSILVLRKGDSRKITLRTIKNGNDSKEVVYDFEEMHKQAFDKIFSQKPEIVNQHEFVQNGSIKRSKLYIINEKLVLDYTAEEEYISIEIDPNTYTEPIVKTTEIEGFDKVKDINSYVFDDRFYLFINNKEDLKMQTYDRDTATLLDRKSMTENVNDLVSASGVEDFIKQSKRNRNKVTGTVNPTKNNNLLVTLDYVDKNNYNYHHDWWFHHWMMQQHMQMMQQQMIQQQMNSMNSFGGPNADTYNAALSFEDIFKEETSIQFVLKPDFEISGELEEAKFKDIDKDLYIDKFKDRKGLKHQSLAFTTSSIRYIFYSKATDSFHVETEQYYRW
jgi:hypothetical protein